jgi:hypothetical protein
MAVMPLDSSAISGTRPIFGAPEKAPEGDQFRYRRTSSPMM